MDRLCYVQDSQTGYGVFAKNFIKKNSLIWKCIPNVNTLEFISESDYCTHLNTVDNQYEFVEHTFIVNNKIFYIADMGKYFNHNDHPNCRLGNILLGECPYSTYAKQDIRAGEELYDDYNLYNNPEWFNAVMDSVHLDYSYYGTKKTDCSDHKVT